MDQLPIDAAALNALRIKLKQQGLAISATRAHIEALEKLTTKT